MAGWWSTTIARPSSTRRACSLPYRRSASACRRAPASPFPARAGLSCNGGPRYGPPYPPAFVAPRGTRCAPRSPSSLSGPRNGPHTPNARDAPAEPWRPSITDGSGAPKWPCPLDKGGAHVLRASAIRRPSRAAEGVGEVHGGGDHPIPGQDGHGDPRQLRRRGGGQRVRLDPALRKRGGAQAPLRPRLPERLLEERDLAEGRRADRPRADQGPAHRGYAALRDPVAHAAEPRVRDAAAGPRRPRGHRGHAAAVHPRRRGGLRCRVVRRAPLPPELLDVAVPGGHVRRAQPADEAHPARVRRRHPV